MPDAAAGDVVGLVAGGEARGEEQLDGAGHVDRVGLLGGDEPGADGLGGHRVAIDAAAVVGHRDDDVAAGVAGGDRARVPAARLAGGLALGGRLEAVVERVAHEVHERVAERVDDGAVELGVLADELELDLLAELAREVADEPREAQEDGLHGDHPDLHDDRLQGVRAAREVLHGLREARDLGLGGEDLDLGALDDELAHEVHELVQALGVDAHGGGGATALAALAGHDGHGTGRAGSAAATTPASATSATSAAATSGTAVRAALSAAASTPAATHTSTRRPSKASTWSSSGAEATTRAQVGGGGDDHVGPHRRHEGVVGQRDPRVQHGVARADRLDDGRGHRRRRRAAVARDLLVGGAVADEALQALDERRGLQALGAVGLDGVGGALERVEALEQDVDRLARQAARALAQQLEDVLHLVGEGGHAREAHGRAHALQRMGDAEDLVDRRAVLGLLLDAHDGEVELLQVLAALGEEHREVLARVHRSGLLDVGEGGHGLQADRLGRGDALGGADDEDAAGAQRVGEAGVERVADVLVEVDDRVAAQDEVVGAGRRAQAQQVADLEGDERAQLGGRAPALAVGGEEARERVAAGRRGRPRR